MGKLLKMLLGLIFLGMYLISGVSVSASAQAYRYNKLKNVDNLMYMPNRSTAVQAASISKSAFKIYKVIITSDTLNIRSTPSAAKPNNILGNYVAGNIIDIIGKSGTFLKSEDGYIAGAYTRRITGMYACVGDYTPVMNIKDGHMEDRVASPGKQYRIIDSKDDRLLIKIGRINGYISQDALASIGDEMSSKITIGWDYLNKRATNNQLLGDQSSYVNTESDALGLDVLSPTWFSVAGNSSSPSSITVNDIADINYVKTAHKNGYEVWARFSEMDKTRAAVEFKNKTVRSRLIDQLSKLALYYDLDGINVDYEALGAENRDGFTAFVKELYSKLKGLSLNVSVDITKISKASSLYSLCYDRPALAKNCDYLMLMGYDEHYSTSKEPGSVGSYNFIDSAIHDILVQGVPNQKLILAVPFYLRDFTVIPYDAVVFDEKGKIYDVPFAADNNLLLYAKKGNVFKCTGSDEEWYAVEYNGVKGFIKKDKVVFVPAQQSPYITDSSITVTDGEGIHLLTTSAINMTFPYNIVITSNDCNVYKSENEIENNKICDTLANSYYKCIGLTGDWYVVEYNNTVGYVNKSQATYGKADSRALSSSAVSMKGAGDLLMQNGGSVSYDTVSQQDVGVYFKDGLKHFIWLENSKSMGWRMDMVNNYDLGGAAAWSLYWKPTGDIWDVIKEKLKN